MTQTRIIGYRPLAQSADGCETVAVLHNAGRYWRTAPLALIRRPEADRWQVMPYGDTENRYHAGNSVMEAMSFTDSATCTALQQEVSRAIQAMPAAMYKALTAASFVER